MIKYEINVAKPDSTRSSSVALAKSEPLLAGTKYLTGVNRNWRGCLEASPTHKCRKFIRGVKLPWAVRTNRQVAKESRHGADC